MSARYLLAVMSVLAAAGTVAGCGGPSDEPVAEPSSTSTQRPEMVDETPVLGPSEQPEHDDEGDLVVLATPPAAEAAIAPAEAVLTAWARPDLDYATWWAGVAPVLSPGAQIVIATTDPEMIPVTAVTDPGRVGQDSGSAYLVWVDVPTDAGTWSILMSFDELTGEWMGETITRADVDGEVTP